MKYRKYISILDFKKHNRGIGVKQSFLRLYNDEISAPHTRTREKRLIKIIYIG